ncbi:MAG: TonB-dependent receptor, partial [Phenylobacterium sp.]
ALFELFIGNQTSFTDQTAIDPCIRYEQSSSQTLRTNCAAAGVPQGYTGGGSGATIITGGGAGILKAETSKAATVGLIWTPHFNRFDLSVGVDWFDVTVNDEVRQFGASNIISQCYLSQNFPNDPLCALFTRDFSDPANPRVDIINDSYVNVANQKNNGIDVNFRYRQEFSIGTFTVDGQMTWQMKDITQLLGESEPEDFNGSTTESDFTGQVQLRYDRGDWTAYWLVDLYSKASDSDLFLFDFTDVHTSSRYGRDVYYKQYTEFQSYHSVSVRKKMDNWSFVVGVRNIFDDPPPALSGNEGFRIGYAALNNFDLVGRRAFFQIDRKF